MSFSLKRFLGFETEEDEISDVEAPQVSPNKAPVVKGFKGTVVDSSSPNKTPISEIKIEEPRIYEDSLNIATYLRDNKPVIINLKYLDGDAGKRLIDFVCGTAYAINGHMVKIGENIFLFTPANVLIVDSEEKMTMSESNADRRDFIYQEAAS